MSSFDFENAVEYVSDGFYEIMEPGANHMTGKVDVQSVWPGLEATICKFRQLGIPMREISAGYAFARETVGDYIDLAHDLAIREQFGD